MSQPFVPAPNTVQVEMVYKTNGGIAENVYHVQYAGTLTDTHAFATAIATAFGAWETAHGAGARSVQISLTNIRVRDISAASSWVFEYPQSVVGGDAQAACPDNVTVAIKWQTARGGRSYRGRTYHIGLPLDSIAGDKLGTAAAANFPAVYQALVTGVAAASLTGTGATSAHMAVVSKRQNKAWLSSAVVTQIQTATLADTNLDSMRRRLAGRGA